MHKQTDLQKTEHNSNNWQLMSPKEHSQILLYYAKLMLLFYSRFDSQPSSPNILSILPAEVIIYILSFLDPSELTNLRAVNTTMRGFASDDSLWKELTKRYFSVETIEQTKKAEEEGETNYLSVFYNICNESFKNFDIQDKEIAIKVKKLIYAVIIRDTISVVTSLLTDSTLLNIRLKTNPKRNLYEWLLNLVSRNPNMVIFEQILIAKASLLGQNILLSFKDLVVEVNNEITHGFFFLSTLARWYRPINNYPDVKFRKDVVLWLFHKTPQPIPNDLIKKVFKRAHQLESFPLIRNLLERVEDENIRDLFPIIVANKSKYERLFKGSLTRIVEGLLLCAFLKADIENAKWLLINYNISRRFLVGLLYSTFELGEKIFQNPFEPTSLLQTMEITFRPGFKSKLSLPERVIALALNLDLLKKIENHMIKLENKQEQCKILKKLSHAIECDLEKPLYQTIREWMSTAEGLNDFIKLNEKPEHEKVRSMTFFSKNSSSIEIIFESLKEDISPEAQKVLADLRFALVSIEAWKDSPKKLTWYLPESVSSNQEHSPNENAQQLSLQMTMRGRSFI